MTSNLVRGRSPILARRLVLRAFVRGHSDSGRGCGRTLGAAETTNRCADILELRDAALDRALVWDVVGWCNYVTDGTTRRLLRAAGVHSDFRRVCDLQPRQLDALVNVLRAHR